VNFSEIFLTFVQLHPTTYTTWIKYLNCHLWCI